MELQCANSLLHNRLYAPKFSSLRFQTNFPSSSLGNQYKRHVRLRKQTPLFRHELKWNSWLRNGAIVSMSNLSSSKKLSSSAKENGNVPADDIRGLEPFRGKSGSVSFVGVTQQLVEESKLESAPFEKEDGSFLWVVAPTVLILSLVLPRNLIGSVAINGIKDEVLTEGIATFISEFVFYIGVGIFLFVTDRVQKPYLEFSAKRWSLITGLPGYFLFAFIVNESKMILPLFVLHKYSPVLGAAAFVAVGPLFVGCLVQFVFEKFLEQRRSSCWPLVPIIFEVYRLYQLNRAVNFLQKLIFGTRKHPMIPELVQIKGAIGSVTNMLDILSIACLWSLLTFLIRLFPSRRVFRNY